MTNRLSQLLLLQKELPNDSFLLFALAKEYEKAKQMNQALDYYLELLNKDPEYVGTYYHLGKLYEHFEKAAEAFQTYTTGMAVSKKQGDQHSMNELAGARLNLGDEEDFE
ncbi:MAG: tetratricopeptide (TPR) repeat protein [Polaribacter sp.]|jgi:tetratricopeptide (TPR) repeat protein